MDSLAVADPPTEDKHLSFGAADNEMEPLAGKPKVTNNMKDTAANIFVDAATVAKFTTSNNNKEAPLVKPEANTTTKKLPPLPPNL